MIYSEIFVKNEFNKLKRQKVEIDNYVKFINDYKESIKYYNIKEIVKEIVLLLQLKNIRIKNNIDTNILQIVLQNIVKKATKLGSVVVSAGKVSNVSKILKVAGTIFTDRTKALEEAVRSYIVSRTLRGYDKNNEKFKEYKNKYYIRRKSKITGYNYGISDVDLSLTGQMLNSFIVNINSNGEHNTETDKIDYGFTNEFAKSKYIWNRNRGRDFIGIEKKDLKNIYKEILNEY